MRAEQADVIPSIQRIRPDGITTTEIPGISLLDADMYEAMSPDELIEEVAAVIATPVADLLDSTVSMLDLVPMLTAKPWLATRALRDYLTPQGYHLPTSW
ncbi:hypothetical protein GCM10023349_02510 [Nocardioides conyzicola]|uniref:Uncharacterized protein n=2 Tax=Nocardioides conyzicola TaxID=1651781 RepID=A0ABP8WKK2_9ACTN